MSVARRWRAAGLSVARHGRAADLSVVLAQFLASARRTLRAPGELAVRVAFYLVILVIFAALWRAATAARGGSIAGYDAEAFLWYVVAAEGAVVATKPRMIESIGWDIASGAIVSEMLRPASVVGLRLAAELGEALVRLCAALLLGVPVALALAGPPSDVAAAALALPALVLAVAANLAAQHAFAAAAFWLRDARATWFLYQKVVFLLGGMLLPLELLPRVLADAARALPFSTMAYAPGRLLSGHVEPWLLLVQAAWLVALVAGAAGAFALGERRLQAVGV